MATIVQDKKGNKFIVLGAGYSTLPKVKSGIFFRYPTNKHGNADFALTVCDQNGKIFFIDPDDVTVVSVDGESLHPLYPGPVAGRGAAGLKQGLPSNRRPRPRDGRGMGFQPMIHRQDVSFAALAKNGCRCHFPEVSAILL